MPPAEERSLGNPIRNDPGFQQVLTGEEHVGLGEKDGGHGLDKT
jgi:hypothetical protein